MIFLKLLSRLPLSILYFLSDLLYLLFFYVLRYRKTTVFENLSLAFPHYSKSQISSTAKMFYKNLSDIIVEAIKACSISSDALSKRIKITNIELINAYYAKQVPVIVMTSHLCNWEWLLLSNCVLLEYEVDAVYKRLSNRSFDLFMKELRGRFGANMIEKNSLVRSVAKRRNVPRIIAMVSDQAPANATHYFNFLGTEAPFYQGAEKIALMTNYSVLFVSMKRVKRGYYEITFNKISDPPHYQPPTITERYIELVESEIRKYPENWLWSHRRWKRTLQKNPDKSNP